MSQKHNIANGTPIKCTCGQMVARMRNGKIYVYCKKCKREMPVDIEPEPKKQ